MARERYEKERNALVTDLMADAVWLEDKMKTFKSRALARLNEFRQLALEYGEIRSNSKGGFLLRHSYTQEVVSLDRNTVPEYDERASLVEQLLKEFLEDKVKNYDFSNNYLNSTTCNSNHFQFILLFTLSFTEKGF